MKRCTQYFSKEYLQNCQAIRPDQIAQFLEDFRLLHTSQPSKKRLISLRISESLLKAAKAKARAMGVPYQTQIQRLLEDWVKT